MECRRCFACCRMCKLYPCACTTRCLEQALCSILPFTSGIAQQPCSPVHSTMAADQLCCRPGEPMLPMLCLSEARLLIQHALKVAGSTSSPAGVAARRACPALPLRWAAHEAPSSAVLPRARAALENTPWEWGCSCPCVHSKAVVHD